MNVGDLVKVNGRVGLLIKRVRAGSSYWIVLWSNGVRDTLNVNFGTVVISASR